MRRSWVAVGLVTLMVGLAVGYRWGRSGRPHDVSAPPARESEVPNPKTRPVERPGSRPEAVGSIDEASAVSPLPEKLTTGSVASARRVAAPSSGAVVPPAAPPTVFPPTVPTVAANSKTPSPAKVDPTPTAADDPESDRHPPVLQFLRFDPPEIQDGGVAILSVGATDDLSGVKSVSGTLRSPSEAAAIPFVAQDAGGNGVFTASISIAHQAETGNWFVGMIQIVDGADNPLSVAFAKPTVPPGGTLRVVSAESDSMPPTVHQVTVDKGTVSGGEKNQIVVDVDDDRSGVAFVTGTFLGPSKSAFISFTCAPKGEGTWVGDVPVPINADCGEWTVYQLRVTDKAHNTAVFMADAPEVSRVSFGVAGGGGCDSDAPVIDTLYVTPGVVSNATASEVVLTVTAHDEGSGLATLTGRVEGPVPPTGEVPRIFFAVKADPKYPDAPIQIKIAVPQFAAKGIWRFSVIRLTDKAGNIRAYEGADPALANAIFTVE